MKRYLHLLLIVVLLASTAFGQDKPKLIGEIEFFGYAGIDLQKLRAALPFHEKNRFIGETFAAQLEPAGKAVKQMTGQWPTDLTNICCDDQEGWVIFIGLAGRAIHYSPPPKGNTRLPEGILNLYDRFLKVNMENVQQGASAEQYKEGYPVSAYPPLRSIQLQMRAYAVRHGAHLREVLEKSSDEQQRIAAAELLGYARQSQPQLVALVNASRDSNSGVRNNATRALIVLAESSPKVAAKIPAAGFIELLLSGTWTDLNKASNLLDFITKSRSKEMLGQLRRREVLERLIEIARWRSHGKPARYILGRIAGIDESRLEQLVRAGQVEVIISELQGR